MKKFNSMFSDRTSIQDEIKITHTDTYNWDQVINKTIIYAFINHWEMYGRNESREYKRLPRERNKFWIFKGFEICYNRIMNDHRFFGDLVMHGDEKCIKNTLEYIFKHRNMMWY
jgi:hypothetical protein